MKRIVMMIIIFLLFSLLTGFVYGAIPASERAALIALYNSTDGDNWTNNSGWKTPPLHTDGFAMPGTENSWWGVSSGGTTVIRLNLNSNGLEGIIPPELGNLENLRYLYLYSNDLTGSIPQELGNLEALTRLYLDYNRLTGSIPPELGNLENLNDLRLNTNRLTGSIPPELGNLTNLNNLFLHSNHLTGSIPPELGNLENLIVLLLSGNRLTGSIPPGLGNLTNLKALGIFSNRLTGSIPPELGNLENLVEIHLSGNQLTGSIPPELGNLGNLKWLHFYDNQLTGSIPPELGDLGNLRRLHLEDNHLTGSIPPELGNQTMLIALYLHGNQLTGNIPTQLANLSNLLEDYSDFRWNGLFTENDALRNFLNSKQVDGDWESTQTIAPSNPAAATTGYTSIRVSWTPIPYTGNTGGYSVFYGTISGGPYAFFNTTTDKTVSQMDVFGLNPGTTYYFVIQTRTDSHNKNQNTVDSEYGDEVFASTLLTTPTVTTAAVTDITAATALCGGNVTSNGGAPVTARGVCWSTSPNPTTADNFTNDGDRAEAFTTTVTGLTENTVYYVRAYAVNTAGTAYGRNVSFTTAGETLSVTITEPLDGADVAGTVTIKAAVASGVSAAADDSPFVLSKLEFYIDSSKTAEFTSEPHEYEWDTTAVPDGTHTIKAIAYNLENQTSFDEITVNVSNNPASPAHISLNRTRLNYGAAPGGTVTGPQFILVNNTGEGVMNWTAAGDSQWLFCSPTSGTGNGIVHVSVNPGDLAPGTYTAAVTVESAEADNSPQTVDVYLTVYSSTTPPSGGFDAPGDGSVVKSSIPVTGWAIDDIDVESVKILRTPLPGEETGLMVVGNAFLVEGARPDVETSHPGYPRNYRAGWGYMLLTYYLPNRGSGTYTLHAVATDKEGNEVTLGSKTITCDNANAVKPFGAIDTPQQGGIASGGRFENCGWALTPLPNTIPTDGSTITVYVDGVPLGHPVYNIYREDIAARFPGYNNSNGAVGNFNLDTTAYENGIHTIQWTVSDDAGNSDEIGTRYFSIQNGQGTAKAEGWGTRDEGGDFFQFPVDRSTPLQVIKGYGKKAEPRAIYPDENGEVFLEINELERLEIHIPNLTRGCRVVGGQLRMLPVGSTLDKEKGIFYWSPGPGFTGEYRLVFAIKGPNQTLFRKNIIVTLL